MDAQIEASARREAFAAIGIGETSRQIVAFTLKDNSDPDEVGHTLNTIRHAINLKLRSEKFADRFAEARAIQLSLLPAAAPVFGDYDIFAASIPAEEVGGDLYDFIRVSQRSLGIAVADASGHGLPAALQARDAIIGLRMGVEENLRISATLEKLNRVVNHSALASKFISLFYAGARIRRARSSTATPGTTRRFCGTARRSASSRAGRMILGPNPTSSTSAATTLAPTCSARNTNGVRIARPRTRSSRLHRRHRRGGQRAPTRRSAWSGCERSSRERACGVGARARRGRVRRGARARRRGHARRRSDRRRRAAQADAAVGRKSA